jgi:hypothetical protein
MTDLFELKKVFKNIRGTRKKDAPGKILSNPGCYLLQMKEKTFQIGVVQHIFGTNEQHAFTAVSFHP